MAAEETKMNSSDLEKWKLDFTAKIEDPPMTDKLVKDFKKRSTNHLLKDHKNSLIQPLSLKYEGLVDTLGDKSLLKILRYKNYDTSASMKMIENIVDYRINYPERWIPDGHGPRDYAYVFCLRSFEALRYRNPLDGSLVIIIRMGDWTPDSGVDFIVVSNAIKFVVDCVLDDERIQRDGATLILDCTGMRLSWIIRFFPPTQLSSAVAYAQDACPLRFSAIHIVNQPYLYTLLYSVIWPFLSKDNQRKIHVHGKNMENLHKFVDREILPDYLHGPQKPDFDWLPKIMYEQHEELAARMSIPLHFS